MKKSKSHFYKSTATERKYARQLNSVAEQVGKILNGLFNSGASARRIKEALSRYADIITPWAQSAAAMIVGDIDHQDKRAWRKATQEMSIGLRENLQQSNVGQTALAAVREQVELIRSLPLDAAERAQNLVQEAFIGGRRAEDVANEIARSGEVTKSRAKTIARTETSRIATEFTKSRAEYIGGEGYIWRTAHDSDVRPSHKKMEGKYVPWSSPPTLDGMTGHAGQFPNCRCYPEPVIPKEIK